MKSNGVYGCASGTPAKMLTPGAMMSSFRMPGLRLLGPRPEKPATMGARIDDPRTVSPSSRASSPRARTIALEPLALVVGDLDDRTSRPVIVQVECVAGLLY